VTGKQAIASEVPAIEQRSIRLSHGQISFHVVGVDQYQQDDGG
jgi:hypothetical protein